MEKLNLILISLYLPKTHFKQSKVEKPLSDLLYASLLKVRSKKYPENLTEKICFLSSEILFLHLITECFCNKEFFTAFQEKTFFVKFTG